MINQPDVHKITIRLIESWFGGSFMSQPFVWYKSITQQKHNITGESIYWIDYD